MASAYSPKSSPRARSRGRWRVVLLLLPAVLVPLLVPLHDRVEPSVLGVPFYAWFQFVLIPCAAVLTVTAFFLAMAADRDDPDEG